MGAQVSWLPLQCFCFCFNKNGSVFFFFLIIHDCYTKLSNPTFVPKISLVYIVPNSSKHLKV